MPALRFSSWPTLPSRAHPNIRTVLRHCLAHTSIRPLRAITPTRSGAGVRARMPSNRSTCSSLACTSRPLHARHATHTARRTTMRRHSRRSRRCAVPRRSAAAASVCRGSPCQQRQPAWRCASSMPAGAVLWGMNRGRAQSRRRCGRGEPSPGADGEGVSPSHCQAGQWQVVDNQLDLLRSERGRRGAAGLNRSGTPSRTDRPISRCRTRTRARCVRARTHTQHSFLRLVGRRSPTQRKSTAR